MSTVTSAHELWLDSENFQYENGDKVEISLMNGTNFDGVNLPYFTRRVSDLYYSINTRVNATSRLGDLPAFQQVIDTPGLARFVYVSKIDNITYRGLKKFTAFVEEKDASWALERHLENKWPTDRFTERYFRHSKALIDIGHAQGADETFGLFVEFTALKNPYTDDMVGGMPVTLTKLGNAIADGQIEVFERAADGTVNVFKMTSDAMGHAVIPVRKGHDYLLDHVVLTEVKDQADHANGVYWQSDWAAMTFSVPK
jgi:cobalt/nickel transport protein